MTTKLTYWERSPQESTQSARDCTLDRNQKEHFCKQVSHTLIRLTSTAPPQVNLASKAKEI